MANKAMAACMAAGRAYCPDTGQGQEGALPLGVTTPAQPMTEQEALADALHLLAPATPGAAPAVTPHHVDTETTLAAYEKQTYGGKHVNTAFAPEAQVWVIEVDAAPSSAVQNVPQGVKPAQYNHFTVVFDVKSHHWIEKYLW